MHGGRTSRPRAQAWGAGRELHPLPPRRRDPRHHRAAGERGFGASYGPRRGPRDPESGGWSSWRTTSTRRRRWCGSAPEPGVSGCAPRRRRQPAAMRSPCVVPALHFALIDVRAALDERDTRSRARSAAVARVSRPPCSSASRGTERQDGGQVARAPRGRLDHHLVKPADPKAPEPPARRVSPSCAIRAEAQRTAS